jgi:hypothetical protein
MDGAHSNDYEGANGGCNGQGADGAHDRVSGGAHTNYDEGRACRRVGARGGNGARGGAYDDTHGTLIGGIGDHLKGGDGRS